MSERKRFRVRYDRDPGLSEGERHVFAPSKIIEEWSLTSARVRPDPVHATEPRPGDVVRVIPARPQDGRDWWEIMAEDPAPLAVAVETILSVMAPVLLAPYDTLGVLLDHLASRPLTDPERAGVANACEPWLRRKFPDLARAADYLPDYVEKMHGDVVAAEPLYRAYCAGVRAVVRDRILVPVPPFVLTPVPKPPDTSPNLRVRPDVIARLLGRHRAN